MLCQDLQDCVVRDCEQEESQQLHMYNVHGTLNYLTRSFEYDLPGYQLNKFVEYFIKFISQLARVVGQDGSTVTNKFDHPSNDPNSNFQMHSLNK